jgi:hypothetical protein
MKSLMDIIALMHKLNLRKNTGSYTFGFIEDKYKFVYNNHDTGRYINIHIIAPDGDSMLIYDKTEWYSSRYYFNGFGNGFVNGPWVKEIETLVKQFKKELIDKLQVIRKNKKILKALKEYNDNKRYNKFASLVKE